MKALTCNEACAAGFATDREYGLIYGPNLYTNESGDVCIAMDREEWSHITQSCAYCGNDIIDDAVKKALEVDANDASLEELEAAESILDRLRGQA